VRVNPLAVRRFVKSNLESLATGVNLALSGGKWLDQLEEHVAFVVDKKTLPGWFQQLRLSGGLGRTDGKSVGSTIEVLFAAVLRYKVPDALKDLITVKSARGVDLPEIGLGVKAPSENFCTSEPFLSPYQRLLGHTCDSVVLLTDYQDKKGSLPLKLQVTRFAYFTGSEQADKNLCATAKKWRKILKGDQPSFRKVIRFLTYSNQSDSVSRAILKDLGLGQTGRDYMPLVKRADLWADKWGLGGAHWPAQGEWDKIISGKLDGKCGMSDARQWRNRYSQDTFCPVRG
jgi:hypothetical protein